MSRTHLMPCRAAVAVAVLGLGLTAARSASAQTCKTDADCPQSFACVASGVVNGTTPACPPGAADCAKPDPAPKAETYYSCQPKTCAADADCGSGMVCHAESSSICSGGSAVPPCAPNTDCPAPTKIDPTCTTTTRSVCAFKWQLPCNASAECGDGFTCKPQVIGMCSSSGSGGTATPGDAGSAPTGSGKVAPGSSSGSSGGSASTPTVPDADGGTRPADSCTTTTSFPGYCQPNATTCGTDTDCPASWKCVAVPSPGGDPVSATSTAATPSTGASAPDRGGSGSGTSPPAPGTTPVASKICAPPGGLGISGSDTIKEGGGMAVTPTSGSGSGNGGPNPLPPTAGAGDSKAGSAGGCSMNPNRETSLAEGLALFTLLGLFAVRRLRRS